MSRHGLFHYSARQRYAACLERPAPRSMLATRTFWILVAGCLFAWGCVVRAAVAFWRWA